MRRVIMFSLVVSLILGGCIYKKVDSLSLYRLEGKVFDGRSKAPVNGASIFFIDKGLDEYRKKIDKPIKICETNSAGEIEKTFEYFWGRTEGAFRKKPTGEFIILIKKNGYNPKALLYNEYKLRDEKGISQVGLGNIYLEKQD